MDEIHRNEDVNLDFSKRWADLHEARDVFYRRLARDATSKWSFPRQ